MNGSPAIWSENRVHRAHSTQRSRSSSTWEEMLIGLGNVRLTSSNRVSARPLDIAWFCSGHSPPLSQTGQSSGWLISRSSITPCCALSAASEVNWVRTTMSGVTVMVHDAMRLALALDLDQALPAGADRVEQRVVAEPRDLDADQLGGANHQRALGHADLVRRRWSGVTISTAGSAADVRCRVRCAELQLVCGHLDTHPFRCRQHRGVRVERAAAGRGGRGTRRGRT